jgi:hypothetical protein
MHGETLLMTDTGGEASSSPIIMSLHDSRAIETIRKNFSPALVHKNIFSENELKWLYCFAFSKCRTVRHNANGTIFVSGNFKTAFQQLKEKILPFLPQAENSVVIDGNFFITPSQYGLHNDSIKESDFTASTVRIPADHPQRRWVPWKNVIIPIWVAPPDTQSHICFFEQRHIDWSHVYNHGGKTKKISTMYPVIDNMADVQFYNASGEKITKDLNSVPYPEDHFKSYFRTPQGKDLTPYFRFTGLKPEGTFEWTPGDLMIFDAMQLHATNNGNNVGLPWALKMGLLFKFYFPVSNAT